MTAADIIPGRVFLRTVSVNRFFISQQIDVACQVRVWYKNHTCFFIFIVRWSRKRTSIFDKINHELLSFTVTADYTADLFIFCSLDAGQIVAKSDLVLFDFKSDTGHACSPSYGLVSSTVNRFGLPSEAYVIYMMEQCLFSPEEAVFLLFTPSGIGYFMIMTDNLIKEIISIEKVQKSYGSHIAVNDLSFSVPQGICFGLLGPNGAGKTTTMKMVYGMNYRDPLPQSRLSVFGHDPQTDALPIKFVSGVVPQENNLDEELNVEQNLKVFSRFYNLSAGVTKQRINELLEFMELSDKHRFGIKQLSGGMKRRLIIARALLNNPKLLILDEPTTGLDPQVRHLIWDKLRLLKRSGMTILITTHYMEEAFQICDTVLIMNKGKKVVEGNPQELVRQNIEPYVMEIYSKDNFALVRADTTPQCCRIDESTDIVRIYSADYDLLRDFSKRLTPGDFYLRQSNLEDLFLKATGSSLNAQQ